MGKVLYVNDYLPSQARHTKCTKGDCGHIWVDVYDLLEQYAACPKCDTFNKIGNYWRKEWNWKP